MSELPEWEDLEPGVTFRYVGTYVLLVRRCLKESIQCRIVHPHSNYPITVRRSEYENHVQLCRAWKTLGGQAESLD